MINNFEQINSLLEFPNNDIYYHLQIIRRKKDNPEETNRVIKSYFICHSQELRDKKLEIINLCHLFNARAYINLSPKSLKYTTLLQLKYLTDRIYNEDFKCIWRSWDSCAREIKGSPQRWVVDIDDISVKNEIKNFINSMVAKTLPMLAPINEPPRNLIIAEIPTKNGLHLITKPFNYIKFREKYPGIDVHKNSPTLLYCS